MAISKKGNDLFIGKVGNTVVYPLHGQLVKRGIGISTKPATDMQLASRQITRLISKFISPVKEFTNAGFMADGKLVNKTAYTMATSYNRSNAIKGDYPNQEIDYERVLLSRGTIPIAHKVSAKIVLEGIEFTWDTAVSDSGKRWNDQAMLIAYMPEVEEAEYLLNGCRRTEGRDVLRLLNLKDPVVIETYISFISANHKKVSDSIYTGQFLWGGL